MCTGQIESYVYNLHTIDLDAPADYDACVLASFYAWSEQMGGILGLPWQNETWGRN